MKKKIDNNKKKLLEKTTFLTFEHEKTEVDGLITYFFEL